MKFGIIGAMDEEIAFLQAAMTHQKQQQIANVLFIEGEIANQKVVLLKSGIGKVNAAMATTLLIENFQANIVINTGTAGGFSSDLNVGDIVIGSELVHHDVDVTAFDYVLGQVPQLPATFKSNQLLIDATKKVLEQLEINSLIGLVATGDSFMSDKELIETTINKFPAMLAAEMEGAAIAQVCYQYDVPFIVIRAISDIAGEDSPISFNEFIHLASENATKIILKLIQTYE